MKNRLNLYLFSLVLAIVFIGTSQTIKAEDACVWHHWLNNEDDARGICPGICNQTFPGSQWNGQWVGHSNNCWWMAWECSACGCNPTPCQCKNGSQAANCDESQNSKGPGKCASKCDCAAGRFCDSKGSCLTNGNCDSNNDCSSGMICGPFGQCETQHDCCNSCLKENAWCRAGCAGLPQGLFDHCMRQCDSDYANCVNNCGGCYSNSSEGKAKSQKEKPNPLSTPTVSPKTKEVSPSTPPVIPKLKEEPKETPSDSPKETEESKETPTESTKEKEEPKETLSEAPKAKEEPKEAPSEAPKLKEEPKDTPFELPEEREEPKETPSESPKEKEEPKGRF